MNRRIFIEAIRTIQPGEELSYDYQIQRDSDDAADIDEIYACRCGAKNCRGTMLEPPKKPRQPAHRAPGRAKRKDAAVRRRAVRHGRLAKRPLRRGP